MSAALDLMTRLRAAMDVVYREIIKFGAVGALAYVVDVYVYNIFRTGWWPMTSAPLDHKPLAAKVISVAVATVVAWLGNRYWTFRHRRRATARAEFVLFVVMNIGGLVIAAVCIWFSHYVLGLRSALADNISGNVVGLGLGTLFRFWAYRTFVFTEHTGQAALGTPVAAEPAGTGLAADSGPAAGAAQDPPGHPVVPASPEGQHPGTDGAPNGVPAPHPGEAEVRPVRAWS